MGDSIHSVENQIMGTPDYLSPEQARNLHDVDIRSDLYALGCTFYFLLTGKVPFPGGTTLEKLVRHSGEQPVPVEQHRHEVSPPVAAVVRRLMAKDVAARFQTPAELADILAPFASSSPLPKMGPKRVTKTAADEASGSTAWTAQTSAGTEEKEEEIPLGSLPVRPPGVSTSGLPSTGMHQAVLKQELRRRRLKLILISAGAMLIVGISLGLWWFLRH